MRSVVTTGRLCAAILVGSLCLSCARATPAPKTEDMACVERLTIPAYPPIASAARVELDAIAVRLQLRPDATVDAVSFDSAADSSTRLLFTTPIEASLRTSTFHRACGSQIVTVMLSFRLSRQRDTDGRISFSYPNRFEVFDTPPIVNPAGAGS